MPLIPYRKKKILSIFNSADPYWDNVVFLSGFDGQLTDERGHTLNPGPGGLGQCVQAQGQIGSSCWKPNQTNKEWAYLQHADYVFGTGDFTVELRFNWQNDEGSKTSDGLFNLGCTNTTPGNNAFGVFLESGAGDRICHASGGSYISYGSAVSKNTWHAWSMSRIGSNVYFHLDGTLYHTLQNVTWNLSGNLFMLGTYYGADWAFPGLIDEFRITKGIGRYDSSNYVPSGSAHPRRGASGASAAANFPTASRMIPQWGVGSAVVPTSANDNSWNGYRVITNSTYSNGDVWYPFRMFETTSAGVSASYGSPNHSGWMAGTTAVPLWFDLICPAAINPASLYFAYGGDLWGSWTHIKDFQLLGSNDDGATWNLLVSVASANHAGYSDSDNTKVLKTPIANRGSFKRFRFKITSLYPGGSGYAPVLSTFGFTTD